MQIGPRLRIGGSVGKALGTVQKVLPSPGQAVGGAALGIPGMLAGGSLPSDLGGASHPQKAIAGTVAGTAGVLGGAGALGLGPAAGGVAGAEGSGAAGTLGSLGAGGALGGALGLGGDVLDALKAHGIDAARLANEIYLQKKSMDFANQANQDVRQSYDERAPLRALGLQGLTKPTAPDLSGLNRTRTVGSVYG